MYLKTTRQAPDSMFHIYINEQCYPIILTTNSFVLLHIKYQILRCSSIWMNQPFFCYLLLAAHEAEHQSSAVFSDLTVETSG